MLRQLVEIILTKIDEQVDRLQHLIALLPSGRLDWEPPSVRMFSAGTLLGHILECLAGFCAVLLAAKPDPLKHFLELRRLPVNHSCSHDEARFRIDTYRDAIHEGFALLHDQDLGTLVPTVFVPEGEALLTLLLGNLEHLVNHKYQLFVYLKMMGIDVAARDLYRFRGEPPFAAP